MFRIKLGNVLNIVIPALFCWEIRMLKWKDFKNISVVNNNYLYLLKLKQIQLYHLNSFIIYEDCNTFVYLLKFN